MDVVGAVARADDLWKESWPGRNNGGRFDIVEEAIRVGESCQM